MSSKYLVMLIITALIIGVPIVSASIPADGGVYYANETIPLSTVNYADANAICLGLGFTKAINNEASIVGWSHEGTALPDGILSIYGGWGYTHEQSTGAYPFSNYVVNKTGYLSISPNCYRLNEYYYNTAYIGRSFSGGPNATIPIFNYTLIYEEAPPLRYAAYTTNADIQEQAPFNLNLTDTSSGFTSRNWTITYPSNATYESTVNPLLIEVSELGWYGVDLRVCDEYGCLYANNTAEFELVESISPTDVSIYITAWDPAKSTAISNAVIGIYNYTASVWQNWTSGTGVAFFDSTGADQEYPLTVGETVRVGASAVGYTTGYGNITIPFDAYSSVLNLISTSDAPIGTNATLSVVILDNWASTPIEGGTITIVNETAGFARSRVSDAVGTVLFPNINSGRYQITAASTGYQTASTFTDLVAGETEIISFSLVHIGATPVVTDTAGVAQYDEDGNPIIGYDAYGNPITAGPTPDIRSSSERQQALMDDLLGWAEILIPICCIMTLLYIMGYKP